jgi:ABC-type multidrug transport system fused ATPase/permease subunit
MVEGGLVMESFKSIFKYANKGFLRKVFLLTTLTEISSATVTVLLALAGKNLAHPDRFLLFVLGFMIASLIPTLIQAFLRRVEVQGTWDLYLNFIDKRLLRQAGRTTAWANSSQREKFLTSVGPEADNYLAGTANSWYDSYAFLLNIVLNMAAFSVVIDVNFSWVFALSFLVSSIVFVLHKGSLQEAAERDQKSRIAFQAYLSRAWDNILLKNSAVHRRYAENLRGHGSVTRELAGRTLFLTNISVFWVGLASSIPVFAFDIFLLFRHPAQTDLIAAMLITLPRQLQVLLYFRAFFNQIAYGRMFGSRFKTAYNHSTLVDADLSSRIRYDKFLINGRTYPDFKSLIEDLNARTCGRVLISGENGAGKSSLLLLLNSQLENSFYLPAYPQLEIGKDVTQGSTGQRLLMHIDFVKSENIPVLLLDEWDANLDAVNESEISAEIDRLSESRLVIEVRH